MDGEPTSSGVKLHGSRNRVSKTMGSRALTLSEDELWLKVSLLVLSFSQRVGTPELLTSLALGKVSSCPFAADETENLKGEVTWWVQSFEKTLVGTRSPLRPTDCQLCTRARRSGVYRVSQCDPDDYLDECARRDSHWRSGYSKGYGRPQMTKASVGRSQHLRRQKHAASTLTFWSLHSERTAWTSQAGSSLPESCWTA